MIRKDAYDWVFVGFIILGFYLIFFTKQPIPGSVLLILAIIANSLRRRG